MTVSWHDQVQIGIRAIIGITIEVAPDRVAQDRVAVCRGPKVVVVTLVNWEPEKSSLGKLIVTNKTNSTLPAVEYDLFIICLSFFERFRVRFLAEQASLTSWSCGSELPRWRPLSKFVEFLSILFLALLFGRRTIDRTHEKVHSLDGAFSFLHHRSTLGR